MALTGKTIGELTYLQSPTYDTLIPVEYSGDTYHIAYSSITNNYGTYKALLTQTAPIVGTDLNTFYRSLIIGETYTITNYVNGDDFSNVANVTTGTINQTGCGFIATGTTPSIWVNGSELTSTGNLIVDELENSLGINALWEKNLNSQNGVYFLYDNNTGPIYNSFPRATTITNSQVTTPIFPPPTIEIFTQPGNYTSMDDVLILYVYNYETSGGTNDKLFYTPIEINVKQNPDTTPIILSGSVSSNYPFNNASVDLFCDGAYIESFYGDGTTVGDLTELVNQLNTNTTTGYLGTYSDDGSGGIILSMPTNLKERFCATGTLTFDVFSD